MDEAHALGSTLAAAWQEAYGPSLIEVPMSMVASLALFDTPTPERAPQPMVEVVELENHAFLSELYTRWNLGAYTWPRLHHLWLPWFEWVGGLLMSPDQLNSDQRIIAAARHIGALAAREGLADLVTHVHASAQCDLLGHLLNALHTQLQEGSSCPEPTPLLVPADNDIALAQQLHPGVVVEDPAAWSGTRIMHLVRELRQRGIDPRTITWRLRATNPVAAATLATSCALWGLGESVVIGTSPNDATWLGTAEKEVRAALNRRIGPC
ncbi:hypothetical protein [Nocardiopsis metallicus]|uniref:Uncharacterized protein n=1 Tax=Nocardiopsis metallicus TaxID=179819 RepID=A0A840WCY8_9ACTN|nr:hypothetical protein [Nocardiopsis metallicus]MBB5494869.1 hypothetical protein [Nocardiopsis metallicus]